MVSNVILQQAKARMNIYGSTEDGTDCNQKDWKLCYEKRNLNQNQDIIAATLVVHQLQRLIIVPQFRKK